MRIVLILIMPLLLSSAEAQERRRIRVGQPEQMPESWPKLTVASPDQTVTAVEPFIAELAKRDLFSGVVMIAKNGKPVLQRAAGLANREWNVPNTLDTKFNLGSVNKMFTAIAIRQLADAGKLSLDDTIRKHLPDYSGPGADKITIRHLLEHSSGLGHIFNGNWRATPKDRLRSISDYFPLFDKLPLEFEPGSSRRYSNAGFIVLGAIIEKLSGETYYDYVRRNIFEPAGMKDTASYELDVVVPNRAVGYTNRAGNGIRSNIYSLPARGSSAGGGYSTAPDLLRLASAISEGKIKGIRNQGTGVAGGAPGMNAVLEIDPESGYTLIVLANTDPPAAEYVSRQIRSALFGEKEDEE